MENNLRFYKEIDFDRWNFSFCSKFIWQRVIVITKPFLFNVFLLFFSKVVVNYLVLQVFRENFLLNWKKHGAQIYFMFLRQHYSETYVSNVLNSQIKKYFQSKNCLKDRFIIMANNIEKTHLN
jgi:hypothetical protein